MCTKIGKINILHAFFIKSANEAISTPIVSATSGSFPAASVKAAPSTPPEIISGGSDAPTENAPINASSIIAPIIIPLFKSPITSPVNVHIINGRSNRFVPNKKLVCPNMATNPNNIAFNIISVPPTIHPLHKLLNHLEPALSPQ